MEKKDLDELWQQMPEEELLLDAGDLFKNFADSTRIKIIAALSINELCVSDISYVVGSSDSAVSHQLRLLRMAKLVRQRRNGREILYSLDDEHVSALLAIALSHLMEGRGES